jgi:hypothetical protein
MRDLLPCRWSIVLRYRHAGQVPECDGVYTTAALGWQAAHKLKAAFPGERVVVVQDGSEKEATA